MLYNMHWLLFEPDPVVWCARCRGRRGEDVAGDGGADLEETVVGYAVKDGKLTPVIQDLQAPAGMSAAERGLHCVSHTPHCDT